MVVVTGPEGSGTGVMTALLRWAGIDTLHRSIPYAGTWWDGEDPESGIPWPDGTRFVVVHRRPDVRNLALLGRKPLLAQSIEEARAQYDRALRRLAAIPDAFWVEYGAIVREPLVQVANVCRWLGVPAPSEPPDFVYDADAKWLSVLEPRG